AIANNIIVKATRAWDEETGIHPGKEASSDMHIESAARAAAAAPGTIVVTDRWWARATRKLIWIAVPPDDIVDRARDVLQGIVHERALWDGVPEPSQSQVFALASLLDAMLGTALPRVP